MIANVSEELALALDDAGAIVRERFPWWLRPFVWRGVVAITLGRRIYLNQSSVLGARCSADRSPSEHRAPSTEHSIEPLLWHELAHVRQMREAGLLRFGWRYLREYVRNLCSGMGSAEAYRNISYEQEAFAAEKLHKDVDV
jgi:hypothetical protein